MNPLLKRILGWILLIIALYVIIHTSIFIAGSQGWIR